VFILEHHFASTSFASARVAFSNAYPEKEVPNKTIVHRLITKLWDTRSVCDECLTRDKTAEIIALPISNSLSPVT